MAKAPFKMKGFSGFGNSPLQGQADPANEGGKKHNKQHTDGEFDGEEGKAKHPEHGPYTPEDKTPLEMASPAKHKLPNRAPHKHHGEGKKWYHIHWGKDLAEYPMHPDTLEGHPGVQEEKKEVEKTTKKAKTDAREVGPPSAKSPTAP